MARGPHRAHSFPRSNIEFCNAWRSNATPMTEPEKLTPMMQQYFEVKRGLPKDTLLLFRLGDFFELFFDDAVVASRLLGLTLTKRQEHPMAGLPHHAVDAYVGKLLAAGKKVAICDQDEPAQPGKLVRRKLTRILSPGTTLAANQLEASRNRYLCAVSLDKPGASRGVDRALDRASSRWRRRRRSTTCCRSSSPSTRPSSSRPRARSTGGRARPTTRRRSTPCTLRRGRR
jgi:hypothetical protein